MSPGCTHTHPTISRLHTNKHTHAPTPVPGARTGQGKVGGESTLAPRIATDGAHWHQTGKHLQGTMTAVACPPSNGLRSISGGACTRCLEGPSPDEQTWLPLWGFLRPPASTPGCTAALSWPRAPRPLCPAIPPDNGAVPMALLRALVTSRNGRQPYPGQLGPRAPCWHCPALMCHLPPEDHPRPSLLQPDPEARMALLAPSQPWRARPPDGQQPGAEPSGRGQAPAFRPSAPPGGCQQPALPSSLLRSLLCLLPAPRMTSER